MSFADCTGTTPETCQPPCMLEYSTNARDPVCVPPLRALHANLSDADIERIRDLLGARPRRGWWSLGSQATALTAPSDAAQLRDKLRMLHADLTVYVDDRIRRLANSSTLTMNWHSIVTYILRDILHDIEDGCFICHQLCDNTQQTFVLRCTTTYKAVHVNCMREWLHVNAEECPMCLEDIHTHHPDVIDILDRAAHHQDVIDILDRADYDTQRRADDDLAVVRFPNTTIPDIIANLLVAVTAFLALTLIYEANTGYLNTPEGAARPTIEKYIDRSRLPASIVASTGRQIQDPHRQRVSTDPASLPWNDPHAMPPGYAVGDLTQQDFVMGISDGRWYLITDRSGRPMTSEKTLNADLPRN